MNSTALESRVNFALKDASLQPTSTPTPTPTPTPTSGFSKIAMALSGNGCLSESTQFGFYRTFALLTGRVGEVSSNSGGSWLMSTLLYHQPQTVLKWDKARRLLTKSGEFDDD